LKERGKERERKKEKEGSLWSGERYPLLPLKEEDRRKKERGEKEGDARVASFPLT